MSIKSYYYKCFLFLFFFSCGVHFAWSQSGVAKRTTSSHTVAIGVQNPKDVITYLDIAKRAWLIIETSGLQKDKETFDKIVIQVKKGLVEEKMQLWIASQYEILVTESEIKEALSNIAKNNNLSYDQLIKSLEEKKLPSYLHSLFPESVSLVETFKKRLEAQIAWSKVIRATFSSIMHIDDLDIDRYLEQLNERTEQNGCELSEIFLRISHEGDRQAIMKDIQNIYAELKKGARFDVLAQQFSQSPSSLQGGYIGWMSYTRLPEPIKQTIKKLSPGEFTQPIFVAGGLKIFRRLPEKGIDLDLLYVALPQSSGSGNLEEEFNINHLMQALQGASNCSQLQKIAESMNVPFQSMSHVPLSSLSVIPSKIEAGSMIPNAAGDSQKAMIMVCRKNVTLSKKVSRDDAKKMLEGEKMEKYAMGLLTKVRSIFFVDDRTSEKQLDKSLVVIPPQNAIS